MKPARSELFNSLTTDPALLALVPLDHFHGAGSLEGRKLPEPFVVIKSGSVSPEAVGDDTAYSSFANCEIWVHDSPGSYARIDRILEAVFARMCGPNASANGIMGTWLGNSPELFDDGLGTIARYGSYRITGGI